MKKQNNKVFKLIIIAILMLMIVNNVALSALDFFDGIMNNSLPTRTLSLTTYNDYDENKSFDVEELYRYLDKDEDIIGYQENYMFELVEEGKELIKVPKYTCVFNYDIYKDYLEDKSIKAIKENEIILPKYVLNEYKSIEYVKKGELIELDYLIGKEISIKISDNTYINKEKPIYKFKIVGVYDNLKAGTEMDLLINDEFSLEIMKLVDESKIEYEIGEEEFIFGPEKEILIVLKDYKKIEKKDNEIKNKFIGTSVYNSYNLDPQIIKILSVIIIVVNFIMLFIVINTITNVYYFVEKDIKSRRKEFGILKAIGYKNSKLKNILIKENLYIAIKVIIVCLIVNTMMFLIAEGIKNYFGYIYFDSFVIRMHEEVIISSLSILFIISMIAVITGNKILSKLDPIEALKDYE